MKSILLSLFCLLFSLTSLAQNIKYSDFIKRATPLMTETEFKEAFKDVIETKYISEIEDESIDVAMQVLSSMIPLSDEDDEIITDSLVIVLPIDLGFDTPAYIVPSFTEDNTMMVCMLYFPPSTTNMQASIVTQHFLENISPYVEETITEQALPITSTIGIGDDWTVVLLQFLDNIKQSSFGIILPSAIINAEKSLVDSTIKEPTPRSGIRNSQWGDSRAEVERKEGKPDMFEKYGIYNDYYTFEDQIAGYDCRVVCQFTYDDQLCTVMNLIDVNDDLYIQVYNNLKDMLTNKYGEPISSTIDKAYQHTRETPLNIKLGHLSYRSLWYSESNIVVQLVLDGVDSDISLGLIYRDFELNQHEESHRLNEL